METNELFTKDTLLYKKNGRYKNLLKAFNLYASSIITDEGIVINKTFTDRITELNDNLIAKTTCADLIRFVCYKPKMYNALDQLNKESTILSVANEGED